MLSSFRLVVLALVDELVHDLLLGLASFVVRVVGVAVRLCRCLVVPALERGLERVVVVAAAKVKRAGGCGVHVHVVVRVVVVSSQRPASRDGVRGPALLLALVDGFTAVRQRDGPVVVVVVRAVVVASVVEVVSAASLDLPEPGSRETADRALLRGHGRVILAETSVDEGVGLAGGFVLLEQRVLTLRVTSLSRLHHVALVAFHLASEDVELELAAADGERRGLLRRRRLLLEGEAMLGLLARLGASFFLRHGGRVHPGARASRVCASPSLVGGCDFSAAAVQPTSARTDTCHRRLDSHQPRLSRHNGPRLGDRSRVVGSRSASAPPPSVRSRVTMSLCTSILASGARGMQRLARTASHHHRHATPTCAPRLSSRVRCAPLRAPATATRLTRMLAPAAVASGARDADANSRCGTG